MNILEKITERTKERIEEEKKIVYLEILEADNASGMEDAEGKKVLCYLKQSGS